MKSLLKASLMFFLLIVQARWSFAHDGWVEVSSIVERGQPVTLSLMLGNHSNDHKSYRLAGKWNPKLTKLMVIEPSGKVNDLQVLLSTLARMLRKPGRRGQKDSTSRHLRRKRKEYISSWDARKKLRNTATGLNSVACAAPEVLSQLFRHRRSPRQKNRPAFRLASIAKT